MPYEIYLTNLKFAERKITKKYNETKTSAICIVCM